MADHLEVVQSIADRGRLGRVDPVLGAQGFDRGPLVDIASEGLEEVGRAADRVLGGLRGPVLRVDELAEVAGDARGHGPEHAAERDRADADGVVVRIVRREGGDAAVADGKMLEPPRGCRVERLVADHDVVDARLGVVLQEMREMAVIAEDSRDPAHDLGRERATDHDRTVARVVYERAARGDRVSLVVDVVEHMSALGKRAARRGHDLDALVLQPADRLEIACAHAPGAVEQGSIEVGDEHADAHARENTLYPARVISPSAPSTPPTPLHAAEGAVLVDAAEAFLKGVLESQVAVGTVALPNAPRMAAFIRCVQSDAVQKLLARHQAEVWTGGDGARAVALALAAVRGGRSAAAVIPAADIVVAVDALRDARANFRSPEHGLAVVLEDDPVAEPSLCPRRIAIDAGFAVIEPADLSALRDSVEQALRISRAGLVPVAIVVHASMLSSSETIPARPNRVVSNVDELILQRRLRAGTQPRDTGDLLRVARRLELNAMVSLPSPGEREVVGFIASGVCERALAHVVDELQLSGRVPILRLGLVSPVDEATLQRFLDRVQQAVVLETRPGVAMQGLFGALESLRRRGARVPPVFVRGLPPDKSGESMQFGVNEATRPSLLVRRIIHLLHAVRPSLAVATRLEHRDEVLERIEVPPRSASLGLGAAMRMVQQMLVELDQEVRARPREDEDEDAVTRFALEQLPPRSDSEGVLAVEVYTRRRFLKEGVDALRQAARDPMRRLLLVVDVGAGATTWGEFDLARLADAAIPSSVSGRVHVARADLNDDEAARAAILEAAAFDGLTVLVLADGPPARLDADAVDRGFLERDRLGYQPQQRLVWPADIACEIRPPTLAGLLDEAEEQGATPIQGEFVREELGARIEGVQFRATAISEQVEVVRTKPPISAFSRGSVGLTPPRPVHGQQGVYRVHLAGLRTATPGVVARILADAGRAMGYRVELCSSDEPCGRGRRAWAQVLFLQMRPGDVRAPRTGAVPYGEADLVLGMDAVETLRALGPDPMLRVASVARTALVANDGPLEDQFNDEALAACGALRGAVERCGQASHSLVDDFAALCRTNLLSERLLDVVLLGLAYQRGLVPVSLAAIESAVRRAEQGGVGRTVEAFNFGRRLEAGGAVRRSVEERESLERLVRRLALELVRERFGGRRRAARFAMSASGMIAVFERFGDGADADRAARAVVTALHRSIVWGGTRMMRLYEGLIAGLLRADASGALAQLAAEPLADALLVRDLIYVLAMSTSLEQRRRIRERLGVRASHGDTLERRFLSRFELSAGLRRYRLDVRSSDWPAEVLRLLRPIVPWSLRGEVRAQEVRVYAISLAERAARGFGSDPAHWAMCMRRFAMLASDEGLRSMTAAELRAGVEGL
ncbi:MAG: hypothetical protein RL136_1143 [Planctomycetota bacterium]